MKSWAEFEFLPGALDALARLNHMGVRVVVVTNQAAVGRGFIEEDELSTIHRRMTAEINAIGGQIEGVYACLHTPEAGCACRKPATGLFTRASEELRITLGGSIMVGDAETDVQAARAVGCVPIVVAEEAAADAGDGVPVVRELADVVTLLEREVATCS